MKKSAIFAAAALALLSACNGDKKQLEDAQNENLELKGDLQETLVTQDSLFALLNDITDGMNQIKDLEKIVSAPGNLGAESQSRKDQIKRDMMAIQQSLQERRERLAQLESRLSKLNGENANLTKTIQNLKNQIAEQQTEIATLTNKLAEANIQIETLGNRVTTLNTTVDSLNTTVDREKTERAAAEQKAQNVTNELNECYYAIGSSKELKAQKILESGFLRKTKVMKGDFDQNYFTKADKRSLSQIPLHSTKAKVLTNQPADSYSIQTGADGQKILVITDPTRFWQLTNYLVVQID